MGKSSSLKLSKNFTVISRWVLANFCPGSSARLTGFIKNMGFPRFLLNISLSSSESLNWSLNELFLVFFFFSCLIFLELCLYLVLVDTRGVQKIERRVL